ncbi:MAG: hypothetical protein D6812_17885 [Deltaproteobacteria bacterium]|nr:MAG: hypothetical protein D6812_17885 [Deltaproteobacteria bacterium]
MMKFNGDSILFAGIVIVGFLFSFALYAETWIAVGKSRKARDAQEQTSKAGYRIYRDPDLDRFTAPPEGTEVAVDPKTAERSNTSATGLVEVPGPSPAGGFMVDLRGRFQVNVSAVRDAGGKIHLRHEQPRSPEEQGE